MQAAAGARASHKITSLYAPHVQLHTQRSHTVAHTRTQVLGHLDELLVREMERAAAYEAHAAALRQPGGTMRWSTVQHAAYICQRCLLIPMPFRHQLLA